MALRLEDYAMLGDGQSAALAGIDGSIDWLCWPAFDSSPCFAALIGEPNNGFWRIAPDDGVVAARRRYLDASLVLETILETVNGTLELTDWMEWAAAPPRICRRVRCVSGRVRITSELAVRFNYGQALPWLRPLDDRIAAVNGPWTIWFDTKQASSIRDARVYSSFELAAGEVCDFVLTCTRSHEPPPQRLHASESLKGALDFCCNGLQLTL
ncbi:trehalase-like domain-containing protein [Paraburkholderia sp. HD33-4]|uniref:trehalase-like domain-containing protein n=1 Tax=Paraburkholderia sp. HD33-4 TaxID=2883242 RepID=UPI003FA3C8EE